MPSALAFVGGGLLQGFGKGLVEKARESGKAKRDRKLADLALERDEKQMKGRAQFERVLAEIEQKNRLELEGVKQTNRQGLLTEQLQSTLGLAELREGGANARNAATIKGSGERRTAASESAETVANIGADSRETVANIAAGARSTPADSSAAEKRAFDSLVKIHTVADDNGIEATDWNAVADGLEGKGFGKLAKAARSRGKGIADLELRQRAEEFADQMVEEQAGAFSFDSSDFKEDGGSRVRFRARMVREFIAKNGGEGTAAPAIKPAEEPATKPAETPAIKPAEAGPYVGDTPPPNAPDARKSPNDGYWYVKRDGKWQQVQK